MGVSFQIMDDLSEQEKSCLRLFKEKVMKAIGDNKAEFRLFGSRARGRSHENSDIDVLTLVSEKNTRIKNAIWDIAAEIQMDEGIAISALIMTIDEFASLLKRERLIALNIQREGIPL